MNSVMERLVGISKQCFFTTMKVKKLWRPVLFCEELALFFQMSAGPPLASSKTPFNCCRCQRDNSSGVLTGLIRRLFLDASCASTRLYPKNVCSIDEASA